MANTSFIFIVLSVFAVASSNAQLLTSRSGQRVMTEDSPEKTERPVTNYSASATVGLTTSMDVLNDTTKLGKGDVVSYRVVQDGKDPIALRVGDSGEMEVPMIGRVQADGRTCRQLAFDIKAVLEAKYYKIATVILGLDTVSGKSKGKVYLMGDVRQQGPLDIPPDEPLTLSKAILRAGGLGDFADMRRVKLIRKVGGNYKTNVIDLRPVFKDGRLDKDPSIEPGDTVIVPEKRWNF